MRTPADYIRQCKAQLGDPHMSDRELGQRLGGLSTSTISGARYGEMSDNVALKVAAIIGADPGEVLIVARWARERDPVTKGALESFLGKVFPLMQPASPSIRGGNWGAWRKRSNPHGLVMVC